MIKITTATLERVDRRTAERLYNAGFNIGLHPCKVHPGPAWMPVYCRTSLYSTGGESFDALVNAWRFYDACPETGMYPAFYAEKSTFVHISFTNGSNPWFFYGSAKECLRKLVQWGKVYDVNFADRQGFYTATERQKRGADNDRF